MASVSESPDAAAARACRRASSWRGVVQEPRPAGAHAAASRWTGWSRPASRSRSTEGLGALSMGRVATELGVGTMSLYRYVAAKDDLLTLMFDTALGTPPAIDAEARTGATGLTAWARRGAGRVPPPPVGLRVPISAPPLGPNNVAWLEAALTALGRHPAHRAAEAVMRAAGQSGFVRNEATLTADLAAGAAGEQVMPQYGDHARGCAARRPASPRCAGDRLGRARTTTTTSTSSSTSGWPGSSTASRC